MLGTTCYNHFAPRKCQVVAALALGLDHFKEKNTALIRWMLISNCCILDFTLSFRYLQMLMLSACLLKRFLVWCFSLLFMDHKTTFAAAPVTLIWIICLAKIWRPAFAWYFILWTYFITNTAQGRVGGTWPMIRTFCFESFPPYQVELTTRIKYASIERQTRRRESKLFEEIVNKRALSAVHYMRFSVPLQTCEARSKFANNDYVTGHCSFVQAQCEHVTKLRPQFAQVKSLQNNIMKCTLHRLICRSA